jgi:hypothetical protein
MSSEAVTVAGPGLRGWVKAARAAQLTILVAGRTLMVREGPDAAAGLEARIELDPELVDLEASALSEPGTTRLRGALRDGRLQLLRAGFGQPIAIEASAPVAALALAFVSELPAKMTKPVREVLDVLLDAPVFPCLSEEPARTSIRAALDGDGKVRLVQGLGGWLGPTHRRTPCPGPRSRGSSRIRSARRWM